MPYLLTVIKMAIIIAILSLLSIFGANWLVEHSAKDKLYNASNEIPHNKVGLLLGTGKVLSNGHTNLYYTYRIEAAVRLYKAQKVDYILVSGDNSRSTYDEPTTIKNDLITKGIPADKIILDYAGFRTLDSVVRCKEIFGQTSITVISQQFHNERAIYLAKHNGITAVGYNAKDVSRRYGFKTKLRERLARVKLLLDLAFGKKPKFLGEPIEIK
ncbi:SanA/YdcF family protein [Carboxylicivirga sediminis]|nr:ElyC/SanA/YdcF family protein [Carboxylicivirga sediminis]